VCALSALCALWVEVCALSALCALWVDFGVFVPVSGDCQLAEPTRAKAQKTQKIRPKGTASAS
jgi:hypothetical protein